MPQPRGFSLVELSIVLVILGLLTGSILSGQALIRAAELRSVATDMHRYQTAIMTFQDKYMGLPGDFKDATRFWGRDDARCPSAGGTASIPGTCNGNGAGTFSSVLSTTETYLAWQHLALAGLIEGSYSGYVTPTAWTTPPVVGTDVPASKLGNAYWTISNLSQANPPHYEYGYSDKPDIRYDILLLTGAVPAYWNGGNVLRPEEAWNIDTKTDDGKPALGSIRANPNGCTTSMTSDANYNLSSSTVSCKGLSLLLK